MAKAKKLPSGQWRTLIYDYTDSNGKRHYESFTADTKKKSEQLAANYAVSKKRSEKSTLTFRQALDTYIESKEPVLSPATIRGYNNIRKVLIADYDWFCRMKLDSIEQADIQKLINSLNKEKSPKTVRNYHCLITTTIHTYLPNITIRSTLPQKERPDLYLPTDEDIKKLVVAATGTEMEIPILLAAFGMMRRGEICALSMDDINGTTIHIRHSLVKGPDGKHHLKAPKTYSSDRYVEVPQFVIDKIQEKGYITKVQPHTLTVMLQKIIKRENLPHFRFHDLRHYSASVRHALGIPDAYIMEDGGWSSDYVMKNVYRHAMSDRKKEMTDIANSHFDEICNTKCNIEK